MFGFLVTVLFVLLVAVGNLALGFWLVVHLGRGPRSWQELKAAIAEPIVLETPAAAPRKSPKPAAKRQPASAVVAKAAQPAPAQTPPAIKPTAAPSPVAATAADNPASPSGQTEENPNEPAPFEPELFGDIPPELNPAEKIAARIAHLTHCCEENFTLLYNDLDETKLKTEEQVRTFVDRFGQLVERHLNYLDTTILCLQRLGDREPAAQTLLDVLDELSLGFSESQPELASLRRDTPGASELHERLTAVLDAIVTTCRSTRDQLEEALPEFLLPHAPLAEMHDALFEQTSGSALGRLRIDRTLAQWKSARTEKSPTCAAGIVDLDELDELNQACGPRGGNRLLAAMVEIVDELTPDDAFIGRLQGGSVFFLLPDHTAEQAVQTAEEIRQLVEKTTFQFAGRDVRATVSGAAAEIDFAHGGANLLEQLHAALEEAKSYGRNRTFIVDGDYSTLVVPPTLAIEPGVVAI